jgi:serine phosphatase RsbU (regulator of sigma subunit)
MAPGDAVVAFTDGVTDALDARGEEFGDQRPTDDVTVVAVRYLRD